HGRHHHADTAARRRRRGRPRGDVRLVGAGARPPRSRRTHRRTQSALPCRRRRRRCRRHGRPARAPDRFPFRLIPNCEDIMTNDTTLPVIGHWIDGAPCASSSGRTAPVFNPATGAQTAEVALADAAEIDAAIASAQRGYETWSTFSIAKRQSVIFAFRELLNARKGELAEIISSE